MQTLLREAGVGQCLRHQIRYFPAAHGENHTRAHVHMGTREGRTPFCSRWIVSEGTEVPGEPTRQQGITMRRNQQQRRAVKDCLQSLVPYIPCASEQGQKSQEGS